jgi:hypothetical protein
MGGIAAAGDHRKYAMAVKAGLARVERRRGSCSEPNPERL